MTYKEILKLGEGAHVVTVNTERCMIVRRRDGYTLTTLLPEKKMLIQRYSERGHLLWEDKVQNVCRPLHIAQIGFLFKRSQRICDLLR